MRRVKFVHNTVERQSVVYLLKYGKGVMSIALCYSISMVQCKLSCLDHSIIRVKSERLERGGPY